MSAQLATLHDATEKLLERKLARMMELKELAAEYTKVRNELKGLFDGEAQVQVGRYVITGQSKSRNAYQVAACTYWDWQVKHA